ncbi:MAG TPA: L,D-transpeptidase [Longimicrobiales bacterium]
MLEKVVRTMRRGAVAPLATLGLAASFLATASRPRPTSTGSPTQPVPGSAPAVKLARPTMPKDTGGLRVFKAANRARGMKILVSTEDRWLWLVRGPDTLMSVPVAVGMGEHFAYQGRKWFFDTPRGRRHVLNKVEDPVWTVPDWQYYEEASGRGLEVVKVQPGQHYDISDGYMKYIELRDGKVGWVNVNDNFYAPDGEHFIEFAGKLFVPPAASEQRKVHGALGPYALNMGDGYLLHGTNEFDENSIGRAVSHGCVRLNNDEVTRLYSLVPAGTPVYIF